MIVINRIKNAGLPLPEQEYKFHPIRLWRFDFAWPSKNHMVAIEYDGGLWKHGGGRHNRPKGFINDMEKINQATVMGWRVLRYCSNNIDQMVPDLKELLK